MFSSAFCLAVGLGLGFSIMKDVIGCFALFTFLTLVSAGVFSDRYRHYVEEECRSRMTGGRKDCENIERDKDEEIDCSK